MMATTISNSVISDSNHREAFRFGLILSSEMRKRRIPSDVINNVFFKYSETLMNLRLQPNMHFLNFMTQVLPSGLTRYAQTSGLKSSIKTFSMCQRLAVAVMTERTSQLYGSKSTGGLSSDLSSDSSGQTLPSLDSGVCSSIGSTRKTVEENEQTGAGFMRPSESSSFPREKPTTSKKNRQRIQRAAVLKHQQCLSSTKQLEGMKLQPEKPGLRRNSLTRINTPSSSSGSQTEKFSDSIVNAAYFKVIEGIDVPGASDKLQRFLKIVSSSESESEILGYFSKPDSYVKEKIGKLRGRLVGSEVVSLDNRIQTNPLSAHPSPRCQLSEKPTNDEPEQCDGSSTNLPTLAKRNANSSSSSVVTAKPKRKRRNKNKN